MHRSYYVYIVASRSRTLYTGVTNKLHRRAAQHREGRIPGFTADYRIFRLVYFERFAEVRAAIAREKEIKGYRREKKICLIEFKNPTWEDLAAVELPPKPSMKIEIAKNRTQMQKSKAGPSL